jgi:clathrin heavy chain
VQVALDHEQPDAAFEVYKKADLRTEALGVLVDRCADFDRAHEYATKVDDVAVWSALGHAQLARGAVPDAIAAYLLAGDGSRYVDVIAAAKDSKEYGELVRYLMMVRDKIKDPKVDTEIVIAFAVTDKLADLEAFINGARLALAPPPVLSPPVATRRARRGPPVATEDEPSPGRRAVAG